MDIELRNIDDIRPCEKNLPVNDQAVEAVAVSPPPRLCLTNAATITRNAELRRDSSRTCGSASP